MLQTLRERDTISFAPSTRKDTATLQLSNVRLYSVFYLPKLYCLFRQEKQKEGEKEEARGRGKGTGEALANNILLGDFHHPLFIICFSLLS
jgi:hypothetical protein